MPPAGPPPTEKERADVLAGFQAIIDAIEEHEQWQPPNPPPTLFHVWDFANRAKYMVSEYENIRDGKPLKHPDQIRPAPGTGEANAMKVFAEACGRTMMLQLLVEDKSGKTAMLTGQSGPPLDFGPKVKEAVENQMKTVPSNYFMAGLQG